MNEGNVPVSQHIQNLIRQGEHQTLDFKYAISDSRKIARTLAAFSNTEGGKLLIGVKDNGNIAGIESDEEYYMVEAAAQLYCKPEVVFDTRRWEINGKAVLEIIVPPLKDKPCYARDEKNNWLAYVRVKDENLLADGVQLKVWQKEKRKRGIHIRFSKAEMILLQHLKEHESISFGQFYRSASITRQVAENILSDFVIMGILTIERTARSTMYKLKHMPDLPMNTYSFKL